MNRASYGKQLKNARLNAGLTQKEVSLKLKRPQQTIAAWEVGRSQPDLDTLAELLRLYDVSANEFLGGVPSPTLSLSKAEYESIERYRRLDDHGKKILDAIFAIECARMDEERAALTSAAARGGGLIAVDLISADSSGQEHVQAPDDFKL